MIYKQMERRDIYSCLSSSVWLTDHLLQMSISPVLW